MSEVVGEDLAPSFFVLYGRGAISADAIYDWVGRWHDCMGTAGKELHEHLGLTLPEYQVWVYDPDSLPVILGARGAGQALHEAIGTRLNSLINAGTNEAVIRGLRAWLAFIRACIRQLPEALSLRRVATRLPCRPASPI